MTSKGYAAYSTNQISNADPRDVEYRLLAQVTGALIKARDNPKDFRARIDSVLWNRDVWSALRVDLYSDQNQLPKELRASLISVSLWIEKETFAVMDNKGDIDALITVNKNIMAGLKPSHTQEAAEENVSSEARVF